MLTLSEIAHPTDERIQKILDAAGKHFTEHGFRKSQIDDICLDAGISKPTFYKIFNTKQELFFATSIHALEQTSEDFYTELDNLKTAADKIKLFFKYIESPPSPATIYLKEYDTNPQLRSSWLIHPLHQELQLFQVDLVEKFVLEGMARGEFRPGNSRAVACAIVTNAQTIHRMREASLNNPDLFPSCLYEFVADLILNGIKKRH